MHFQISFIVLKLLAVSSLLQTYIFAKKEVSADLSKRTLSDWLSLSWQELVQLCKEANLRATGLRNALARLLYKYYKNRPTTTTTTTAITKMTTSLPKNTTTRPLTTLVNIPTGIFCYWLYQYRFI